MIAYCVSGLGADETIFEYLDLQCEKVCISWIPSRKWETMTEYATRLCEQIDASVPFVLIGVSFGGMLAIEMTKLVNPLATILITSVARRSELPIWIRWAAKTKVNRLLPTWLFSLHPIWLIWFFRIKSARGRKKMRSLSKTNDKALTRFAIDMIMTWQNDWLPVHMLRINAGCDWMLPSNKRESGVILANAGHFAVVENAEKVSEIVNDYLSKLNHEKP